MARVVEVTDRLSVGLIEGLRDSRGEDVPLEEGEVEVVKVGLPEEDRESEEEGEADTEVVYVSVKVRV